MRISWTEKKTNEEVMEMAVYKRPLLEIIRKKTTTIFLFFFFWGGGGGGHINRADGFVKQILGGKICDTESRGSQCTKCIDSLNNYVTRKESPHNELARRTDDREDWEARIANVCNRPGT